MSHLFKVTLSSETIGKQWGEGSTVSFADSGATIHLNKNSKDLDNLLLIQQAARKFVALKIPAFKLTGTWDCEAQWHFWQGAHSPESSPHIEFSQLPSDEQTQLENQVTVFTWAKHMINKSAEDLSPEMLATQAVEFVKKFAGQQFKHKIISGEALKDAGLVGVYNVGRGSDKVPALLELDYIPENWGDKPPALALVGKGITFDSGGYSMKSTLGMLSMKSDMGGAATITAALALAITAGLNKRVKLFLSCAENLVSGHAYKLSDVLQFKNGVSVEVVNTDAEGRLVLADGLILADESGAPVIIDAATLTGAACIALGDHYNGMFSMDEDLVRRFEAIAVDEYDPLWRLPLEPFHQKNCPSDYATTANSRPQPGGGIGGASNAAGFLSRFVDYRNKKWIHFDLAACFRESGDSLFAAGATGRGIRNIARYMIDM